MKLFYSILFCLIILKCAAQPGTLTTSFGANGKVLTDFTKGEDLSYGMAIQSDGKIVLAGETSNYPLTYTDFGVTRYNTNGTLDTTFNHTGKVYTQFNGYASQSTALSIQTDGKIVVGGYCGNSVGGLFYVMARYNANGTLDNLFGSNGSITGGFSSQFSLAYIYNEITSLVIQADGKIIGSGLARGIENGSNALNGCIIRLNSDGSDDLTFIIYNHQQSLMDFLFCGRISFKLYGHMLQFVYLRQDFT